VPLNSQNGTIGALIVKSMPGSERYTEQDKELLQYVCAQVATAIERKQLHARLERMAQYDQLTQLPNRELLRDRLKAAWKRRVTTADAWLCCMSILTASRRSTTPRACGWRHVAANRGQSAQGLRA
jgi:GAF domain-containing protein